MGYRCRFLDNEEYGADDITAVFSQLIGGGVLAYPENVTVAQALDELTAETVGAGVSEYGGLQVSVSDDGILIGQGAAFFDSGVSVEVDSEGILLEYEPGTQVYVSLIYEADFNHVLPSVTTDRPEGDAVLLARINADGTVYDLRSYAQAKGGINTANVYHDFSVTVPRFEKTLSSDSFETQYYMPHTGFKFLLLRDVYCEDMKMKPEQFIADISEEGIKSLLVHSGTVDYYLYIRRSGTKLSFAAGGNSYNLPQIYTLTLA